jgi:hypothetical protein
MGVQAYSGGAYNPGTRGGTWNVANVLEREGIEPAPTRGGRTSWSVFLKTHWRSIVAADFFTAEVWCRRGLVTCYVLFIIELAKRVVHNAGINNAAQRRLDDADCTQLDRSVRFMVHR